MKITLAHLVLSISLSLSSFPNIVWASGEITNTKAQTLIPVVPGKSIGDVVIGEPAIGLEGKGFQKDKLRAPELFFERGDILLRIKDGKVSQIYFQARDLSVLSLRGQRMPSDHQLKTLKRFFKSCKSAVISSGGEMIPCEDSGLGLVYSYIRGFAGIFVVDPSGMKDALGVGTSK